MFLFIHICMHMNRNNHINSYRDNISNGIVSYISPCIGIDHDKYMSYKNDRMKIVNQLLNYFCGMMLR